MDDENTNEEQTVEPAASETESQETITIPPQESATDTSNWDDRDFTTPSGRVIIETDQTNPDGDIVAD